MRKKILGAFTLVELIVVITILAILGTIGFVSLQGYSVSARDSVRLSDLKNITKTVEIYRTKNSDFPSITNPINITFSGATIWQQGTFGDEAIIETRSMGQVPLDPVTETQYAYAVSPSTGEFQVGTILERGSNAGLGTMDSSYAADPISFNSYTTRGTYNGVFLTYTEENPDLSKMIYILGVPSLITSSSVDATLGSLYVNNSFVYKGKRAVPAALSGAVVGAEAWDVTESTQESIPDSGIIYVGTNLALADATEKASFVSQLQDFYQNSEVALKDDFSLISSYDSTVSSEVNELFNSILSANFGGMNGESLQIATSEVVESVPLTYSQMVQNAPFTKASGYSQEPFVTVWKTDVPEVTSGTTTITLPNITNSDSGLSYFNIDIDWNGDGTIDSTIIKSASVTFDPLDFTHDYGAPGVYTVAIYGNFNYFSLNNNHSDADKFLGVKQWGDLGWTSTQKMFNGARNLSYVPNNTTGLESVTNMTDMFRGTESFNADLSGWDVSNVEKFTRMFFQAGAFNGDISSWQLDSAKYMSYMFSEANSFNGDISAWRFPNALSLERMFYNNSSFTGDISSWQVSSVLNFSEMFHNATAFTSNLSAWVPSSATNMRQMFMNASSFQSDLSSWSSHVNGVGTPTSPSTDDAYYCYQFAKNITLTGLPTFTNCSGNLQ